MNTTIASRDQLRWLFVIPGLGGGGAERVLVRVTGALARAGDEVAVMTYEGPSRDVHRLPSGVRRIEARLKQLAPGVGANLRRLHALRCAMVEESPDVVVSFLTHTNVLAAVAARSCGLPVIISERTDPRRHFEKLRWRVLRALIYPWADALVVPSNSVAEFARRRRWNRTVVTLPNPVSPGAERVPSDLPELPSRFVLGVGRLGMEKGFDLLLDAFSRLSDRTIHLVLAGEGPARSDLVARARDLGIADRVHLPGWLADIHGILRRADVFVLSSRYEGFPNVLLEAMSAGCAVVAFDCQSGPNEIIADGVDGLLVPAGSTEGLAAAIDELCSDQDRRGRLGQAAARSVDRFSLPVVRERWRELGSRVAGHGSDAA